MSAWRCSQCNLDWPPFGQYERCGGCGEKCWMSQEQEPMKEVDAEALTGRLRADRAAEEVRIGRRQEFERYYAEREVAALNETLDTWPELGC